MEGNGGQVRAEGKAISSTTSDDVDMMDGQDQETVAGSGTHLGGLVAQKRTKVKNSNASEKVTADVLARRILDYGIVKAEKADCMSSPVGVGLVGVTGGGGSAADAHARDGGARRAKVCDWVPCDPHGRGHS